MPFNVPDDLTSSHVSADVCCYPGIVPGNSVSWFSRELSISRGCATHMTHVKSRVSRMSKPLFTRLRIPNGRVITHLRHKCHARGCTSVSFDGLFRRRLDAQVRVHAHENHSRDAMLLKCLQHIVIVSYDVAIYNVDGMMLPNWRSMDGVIFLMRIRVFTVERSNFTNHWHFGLHMRITLELHLSSRCCQFRIWRGQKKGGVVAVNLMMPIRVCEASALVVFQGV